MFLNEDSKISQRKIWSFTSLLVFIGYVGADMYAQYKYHVSIDMPGSIKWILMTVVVFYFGKQGFDHFKNTRQKSIDNFKNKG